MVFSKVHLACHNIANGIKPGSNSKRLISMLQIAQNCMFGRKVIYVGCKIVHKTMWPKVSVSLIKKQFLFIQGKFHTRKSF